MFGWKFPCIKGGVEDYWIGGREVCESPPASFFHEPRKIGKFFFVDKRNNEVEGESLHANDGDSLSDFFGFQSSCFFRDNWNRKFGTEFYDISHACCQTKEVHQQENKVFSVIEISIEKKYSKNNKEGQNYELGSEEVLDLWDEERVKMFEIFPGSNQEKDKNQRKTDHQKRGGNEIYLKIPAGKELDDKKEDDAQKSYEKPIDDVVEEGQLPKKKKIKLKINV